MATVSRAERALLIGVGILVAGVVVAKILGGIEGDWRPNHFDEWRSLAWAHRFVETGVLAPEEPIGSPNGLARDISDRNRSLGIVAVYGIWLEVAPKPIAQFKALAAVFLLLYLSGMYALIRSIGVRPWASLPALLAVGSIPTDPMLLGPAIAAPSSLSLGLLCFGLMGHLRLTRLDPSQSERDATRSVIGGWALLGITGVALAVVYPLTLIVFGGLVAVDVLARPHLLRTRYVRAVGSLGALGIVSLLVGEWQGDLGSTSRHISELFVVDQSWHLVNLHLYRIDFLVHPPVLLLALFGAGVALTPRSAAADVAPDAPDDSTPSADPVRDRIWIAAAFVGPLLAYGGYHVFGAGLIVPYQRVGLYLNFGAILCCAVALEQILESLDEHFLSRWATAALLGLASAIVLLSPRAAPPYNVPSRMLHPSPAIEAAAARIARDFSKQVRVFATPLNGLYLEGLAGLRVAPEVLDAMLTGEPPPVLDCEADWEIVVGKNTCPRYVLSFNVDGVPVYTKRPGADSPEANGSQ